MESMEAPTVVEDAIFRRIGVDVPVASLGREKFWKEVPARGLAVSNTYGYTCFAHPEGFAVARTADLCRLAQDLKEHVEADSSAKDKSLQSVDLTDVRSLVLSADELVVAVITGNRVLLFDVPALVQKSDSNPFETISVGSDEGCVRDFSWSPSCAGSYVLLSTEGKLVAGAIGLPTNVIGEGVLAACWSPDGEHIAYATGDAHLSITTAGLTETFKFLVPQVSELEDDRTTQVDTVQWVRPDSILLGCVRTTLEEAEEDDEFQLFMIGCKKGDLAEERTTRIAVTFDPLFLSIESTLLPNNSGPYMLLEYLKPWRIALVTSRKSVDDHIVLVAWQSEGSYSPYAVEIGNDAWIPRIELPENQGDNAVIGMAIDRTTKQIRIPDPRDETGATLLPACPVLLCLTLEGKLSVFSFARWGEPDAVSEFLDLPASTRVGAEIAREPSAEIAHDEAPDLDVSQGISDEVSTEDESSSVKSDLEEGGDEDEVGSKLPHDGDEEEVGNKLPHDGVSTAVLQKTSLLASSTEDNAIKGDIIQLSKSASYLVASNEERVINEDAIQHSKSANELVASKSSLYERFTKVAPQPDSVLTAEKTLKTWDTWPISSGNLFAEKPAWVNVGTKGQQLFRAEKLMGREASALEGMYRPYSGDNSSSQLAEEVQRPQSAASMKIPLSTRVSAVSFSQPSVPVGGISTHGPPAASQVKGVSSKLDQAVNTITRPTVFTRAPKEQQVAGQSKGISNVEAAFNLELEKVKKMAEHLDMLMSSFQEFIFKDNDSEVAKYRGKTLEDLEQGVSSLSETAKRSKKLVAKQHLAVEDLLDQGIRVDAWRIYAQSLAEQSGDVRYRDVWIHQKLHPELESKRKSVVEADQLLKEQIADLERHLDSLELNHRHQLKDGFRKQSSRGIRSQGQFQALQNLYNTVNSQRAVAEQLAHCVSLQMKALNISSTSISSSKKAFNPAAAGILRSLGLPVEEDKSSPNEGLSQSPIAKSRSNFSQDSAEFAPVTPWQRLPHESESGPPDTMRRRRDSMDMAWVGAGAAKTTIKRTTRIKPMQRLSSTQMDAVKSQLRNFRKTADRTTRETLQAKPPNESIASSYPQQRHKTIGSPEHPGEHQLGRGDWNPPPEIVAADTDGERLLFSAPKPVRQTADIEQPKDSLFKWANAGSSQATSPSIQNVASFNFTPFLAPNFRSSTGLDGAETTVGASFGDGTIPQNGKLGQPTNRSMVTPKPSSSTIRPSGPSTEMLVSRTASSVPPFGSGTIKAEFKGTISSYRPSLSRKLDLEPEAKSRFSADVPQLKSSEFEEEGRQESPRDSKMAKTRDSGMNGGFGSFRDRLMVSPLSNAGVQPSMFTVNSSAVEPSLQPFASQPALEPGPEISAAHPPGEDGATTVPVPTTSSATGKDAATIVGGLVPGDQQPAIISRPPATALALPQELEPAQPLSFVSDIPVSGQNAFSVVAQDSTATPTSVAGQLFPPTPEKAGLPMETKAPSAFRITTNLTKTGETLPQSFPSIPSSAAGFGSPPLSNSGPLEVPKASPGFQASFQSFGATTSPSPSGSLFGQLPSTPGTSSQQFGFPKPSPSVSLVSFPAVLAESDEEVMEEEAPTTTSSDFGSFGGFGGLGLGSSVPITAEKANPFGVGSVNLSSSPGFGTPSTGGQLFRPASFNLPAAQSSPPQSTGNTGNPFGNSLSMASGSAFGQTGLGSGSTGGGFGSATAFGQAAKVGQGQQALGSALGAFGQTRQLGSGFGASGFGPAGSGGGFASAASGGGFASAATGGGFASAATGGGFASVPSAGGFASLAQGGGFANAASGGGFAGASGANAFGNQSSAGGFQGFGANQGTTGFGGFGGSPGFGAAAQAPLFTQMRK